MDFRFAALESTAFTWGTGAGFTLTPSKPGGALTAGADLVELPSPTVALDGRFEVFDLILDGERRFYVGEARLVARKPHSDG